MLRKSLVLGLLAVLVTAAGAAAADDPSIPRSVRQGVRLAMESYINQNTIDSEFTRYDPVEGKLLRLQFKELHKGMARNGEFYVSCADFVDQEGRAIDVDFLVLVKGRGYRTVQALVHKVDGQERPYDLELPRRRLKR